jgi:hypothetical protein
MENPRGIGAPLPRQAEERWWKVYGPKGAEPLEVVFYDRIWLGKWTHYDNGTFPCDETPDCPGCNQEKRKKEIGNRWTGYMAGWSKGHGEECVIAITEFAANQLLPHYQKNGTLRGCHCKLYRKSGKKKQQPAKNAPVWVEVIDWKKDDLVPQPFPVSYSINRMWGIHKRFVENGYKPLHVKKPSPAMPPVSDPVRVTFDPEVEGL